MQEMNSFIQWHDHEMFPVVVDQLPGAEKTSEFGQRAFAASQKLSLQQLTQQVASLFGTKNEFGQRAESLQQLTRQVASLPNEFGILHIDIPQVPMYKGTIVILFDIDKSGSMNDICSDSSTKIQHIRHALKNFLSVLIQTIKNHPDITVRIGLCVFSHDAHNLFDIITNTNSALSCDEFGFITIHSDNIHSIYKKIDDIEPWGLTNIEKSLIYTKTCLRDYHDANPDHRLIHIQFTDGDATVGKKKYQELMEYVDTTYKHVFIGVGDQHDSYLLTNLSQNTSLGEYRFIDQLDNAGLICGEILYDILFPYAFCDDPIHLIASEGVKIYDWRINQWTSSLTIPPFSGNRSKDFQLCYDSESESCKEDAMVEIYSKMTCLDTANVLPQLVNHIDNSPLPNDLTQFILKQYTQKYLYEVIQYQITFRTDMPILQKGDFVGFVSGQTNINETHIRDKLTSFHAILQTYQEKYQEDESFKKFVQVLKDDIRIALKNLGTQLGYLYSTTRQTSQGHQYSYTPTGEDTHSTDAHPDFSDSLERNITSYTNPDILEMMTQVQDTIRYDDMSEYVVYDDNLPTPIRRNSSTNTFRF